MSKRVRIYTTEDVANHNSSTSCWLIRAGKVYDVTSFLEDHPGGDDVILKYAGKDVEDIMKDPIEHEHSDSAYDMLGDYVVGKIGKQDMILNNNGMRLHLLNTSHKCFFLCCQTGKLPMISTHKTPTLLRTSRKTSSLTFGSHCWGKFGRPNSGIFHADSTASPTHTGSSKAYYLQQVHQPRHLPKSARLFGPDILEVRVYHLRL